MKKENEKTEYERCVLCGKKTDIPTFIPIDNRKNYIAGVGQLCHDCQYQLSHEAKQMY